MGNTLAAYTYDAFGNVTNQTGTLKQPYGYRGYQYDEGAKLYYLNARYYDPDLARFISEDAYRGNMADPLSLNRYTYCSNNPIRYIDPSGYSIEERLEEYLGKEVTKVPIGTYVDTESKIIDYSKYLKEEDESEEDRIKREQEMMAQSNGQTVTIRETSNKITIYIYVNIMSRTGDNVVDDIIPDSNPPITYRQAITQGIIDGWSGSFNGKAVEVQVVDFGDTKEHIKRSNQQAVDIYLISGLGICTTQRDRTGITLYQGESRTGSHMFGAEEFMQVVTHEIGHVMGLGDVYDDPDIYAPYVTSGINKSGETEYKMNKFTSIMNDHTIAKRAQDIDYAMLLIAYNTQGTNGFMLYSEKSRH